jgi:hypothetical protein
MRNVLSSLERAAAIALSAAARPGRRPASGHRPTPEGRDSLRRCFPDTAAASDGCLPGSQAPEDGCYPAGPQRRQRGATG